MTETTRWKCFNPLAHGSYEPRVCDWPSHRAPRFRESVTSDRADLARVLAAYVPGIDAGTNAAAARLRREAGLGQ